MAMKFITFFCFVLTLTDFHYLNYPQRFCDLNFKKKLLKYACMLSHVQLFETPWTLVTRLLCPQNFPGKNTGVSCHFLLQGIFPIQGLNSRLLYCRQSPALQADSLSTETPGNPNSFGNCILSEINKHYSERFSG